MPHQSSPASNGLLPTKWVNVCECSPLGYGEVSAVAPEDLIAPSPRSYHMYYTPPPTYSNFCFIRVQELIEIQHSYH